MATDQALSEAAPPRLLSKAAVLQMTGIGHPVTLWRKVQAGEFPKPIQISPRRSAWVEGEVVAWIRARIAAGPARIAPPGRAGAGEATHEAA